MTDEQIRVAMQGLTPFVGEWTVHARFPGASEDAVGECVFEWALGGAFLVERAGGFDPAPQSLAVIGPAADGRGYVQHYFDSRGVARVYTMTFDDGVWMLLRETADFTPLHFAQRFLGRFGVDGDTIEGIWEVAHDGVTWEPDFPMTYRRAP